MVLAPLLIPIGDILACLVALGVITAAMYFARAFFGSVSGAVGWIPWVGDLLSTGIDKIAQKITNVLAGAVDALDHRLGQAYHSLARLVDQLGREISAHANLLSMLASVVPGIGGADLLAHVLKGIYARIDGVRAAAAAAIHAIQAAEGRIRVGIGHDVLPRVRASERALGRTISRDLDAIRARERALEHGGAGLWKWIRTHPGTLASSAFAGAVAIALTRIGAGWIRCTNWRSAGKSVCGMDASLLESLLADTLLVVGTLSLVDFAREMEGVTEAAVRPISTFWRAT